jgi:Icc-related predicted phosphoesterase
MIFKNWVNKKWYEVVGLKKAYRLEKESFDSGIKVLKEINKLKKKCYLVWGNTDFYKETRTNEPKEIVPGYYSDKLNKMKNLIIVDKRKKNIKNISLIGFGGYVDVTDFIKYPVDKEKRKQKERLKRYNESARELYKLFSKYNPKNFIFLIHYPPYGIMDKIKHKGSPMNGKRAGFEPYNKMIKKYKPILVINGHMHEYQGMKRIGSSIIVNPGLAQKGKAAIIEIDEKAKKVRNIRFIR